MIMSEWKEYRLNEIGTVVGGATPSTMHPEYYDGSIPWITPKDLTNWKDVYISKGERSITEAGYKSASCKIMPRGSVLFSSRAPIGYIAIAANDICTNQGFKSVVPNPDLVESVFLYYSLLYNRERIKALGSGTTFAEISGKVMSNVCIRIPSLQEQRSIASILSSLDSKIENNRKICANLEAQAQAIFKHWFIDFTPFKDGKFVESELGMIPEGWRVGRLGDYCKVKSGYAFKSSWWTDKGNRIIKIKNISGNGNLDMKECSFVSPENCLKAKDFKAIPGDLIIAMTGATIGKFTIIPKFNDDVYINQRVGKFFLGDNPFEKLPFIYSLLKTNIYSNQIVNMGIGSAQSNISGKDIESIKIPYNQREISRFNHILRVVFETIVECQCEISRLSTLRDTLLPKLMSGEIKV